MSNDKINEIEMPEPPEGYKWELDQCKTDFDESLEYGEVIVTYKTVKITPKTKLSDLIGEDGQKNAYLHRSNGDFTIFCPYKYNNEWSDSGYLKSELQSIHRWSHSPFTKYEDANHFVF